MVAGHSAEHPSEGRRGGAIVKRSSCRRVLGFTVGSALTVGLILSCTPQLEAKFAAGDQLAISLTPMVCTVVAGVDPPGAPVTTVVCSVALGAEEGALKLAPLLVKPDGGPPDAGLAVQALTLKISNAALPGFLSAHGVTVTSHEGGG